MTRIRVTAQTQNWPLSQPFVISRGAKTHAPAVTLQLEEERRQLVGRGEACPYPRYGESVEQVTEIFSPLLDEELAQAQLESMLAELPPGSARNALDCALWDLQAKRENKSVAQLLGLPELRAVPTTMTVSLGDVEVMRAQARAFVKKGARWLKLKIGDKPERDQTGLRAVAEIAQGTGLILDANEGLKESDLAWYLHFARAFNIELIEQPLPVGEDQLLKRYKGSGLFCADESFHLPEDLPAISENYDAVNIKLDKTGGLSEALRAAQQARKMGLKVMIGCMAGSSLAMAPALYLQSLAQIMDLDGPLFLAEDHKPALQYHGGYIKPPNPQLWGGV